MRAGRTVRTLFAASALGVLLLELALRLFLLPGYWRPLPPFGRTLTESQSQWLARQQSELAGESTAHGISVFDAELGWANVPGARDEEASIHAGGWRGARDYVLDSVPEGVTRLVAFGESFTFGHEVGDGDTWEARLEALDPALEVPNFGVGAYGTDQALLRAERELPRMRADVVLVGLMLENIGRNVNRYRPLWMPQAYSPVAKPRYVLEGDALRLIPLPFRDRAEYVRAVATGTVVDLLHEHEHWSAGGAPAWLAWSACARMIAGRRAYDERYTPRIWQARGEPFEVTLALLARFRALAREHGARDAVVVIFPPKDDLERWIATGDEYWRVLVDELERRGAPYCDTSIVLREEALAHGVASLYGKGHFSPAGNACVARALHAWLAGWL